MPPTSDIALLTLKYYVHPNSHMLGLELMSVVEYLIGLDKTLSSTLRNTHTHRERGNRDREKERERWRMELKIKSGMSM